MAGTSFSGGRAAQVVIIDTDAERAERLSDTVARHGARSIRVRSGAAAVRRIEAGDNRLLLAGTLADGSTRAFVVWARRNYPGLPLLAIAADAEEALELAVIGADHVVRFPAENDLLGAHISACLGEAGRLRLVA